MTFSSHLARALAAVFALASPGGAPTDASPFSPADARFDVSRRLVEPAAGPTKPYSVSFVTLPTAAPSGDAANDVVPGRDYAPVGALRGSVIVLPIWYGPHEGGPEDVAARYLAAKGLRAFVMPMAWQWERKAGGGFPGLLTGDLDRTRLAMIQTVKDARRVAALLDREDAGRGRVGILGISLGGFVGALTYAVAPEIRAGAFALAGAGVADVMLHPSSETRRLIDDFARRGISADEVRRRCREFDPETWARPDRGERLLLFGGLFDSVVPPDNVERLSKAFGGVPIRWVPGGHVSSALFLPDFLDAAERHFTRFFEAPASASPKR